MKTLTICLLLAGLVVASPACDETSSSDTATADRASANTPDGAQQLVLRVEGMTCSGCENAITQAVAQMPGVLNVDASHTQKQVVVQLTSGGTTRQAIAQAIAKLGYDVPAVER